MAAGTLTPSGVVDGALSSSAGSKGTLTQLSAVDLVLWSDAMVMSDAMLIDNGVGGTSAATLSSSAGSKGTLVSHTNTSGTLT
jgi:hypothetical protein